MLTSVRCIRDLEVDPTGAFFTDPLLMRRFRLRVGSHFGAGCRSRVTITPAAFTSCLAEAAQQFLDSPVRGGTHPGFFPQLQALFGAGAFAPRGGVWLQQFLAMSTRSALEFEAAWDQMQHEVGAFESRGPLTSEAREAGRGTPRRLQHAITQQREHVESRLVHDALVALAPA